MKVCGEIIMARIANIIAAKINHLNYADKNGRVYCRVLHDIKRIGTMDCFDCSLYYGSIQGMGVECIYPDAVSDAGRPMYIPVPDPKNQMKLIAGLIEKKIIPEDPFSDV